MVALLQTIHRDVLGAIILGIVGWRFKNHPEFAKLLFPMDNASGEYIITFLIQGKNAGLIGNEWKQLKEMIERRVHRLGTQGSANAACLRYYKGELTPSSSQQEINDAIEAGEIDSVIGSKRSDTETIQDEANQGVRASYHEGIDIFCQRLQFRISEDLDKDIRQIQTPCQIGCSRDLTSKMASHDRLLTMKDSAKSLSLVLSCLQVMGLEAEIVRIPATKLWKSDEELELGESAFTMLGEALAVDTSIHSFKQVHRVSKMNLVWSLKKKLVLNQLGFDTPWVTTNLEESRAAFDIRQKDLDATEGYSKDVNPLTKGIMEVESHIEEMTGMISGYVTGERMLKGDVRKAEGEFGRFKEYLAFHTGVIQWLNFQTVEQIFPRTAGNSPRTQNTDVTNSAREPSPHLPIYMQKAAKAGEGD